jgi:hypothetical protein
VTTGTLFGASPRDESGANSVPAPGAPDASVSDEEERTSDLDVFDRHVLGHRSSSVGGFGVPGALSSAAFRQFPAFVEDAPFCLPRFARSAVMVRKASARLSRER